MNALHHDDHCACGHSRKEHHSGENFGKMLADCKPDGDGRCLARRQRRDSGEYEDCDCQKFKHAPTQEQLEHACDVVNARCSFVLNADDFDERAKRQRDLNRLAELLSREFQAARDALGRIHNMGEAALCARFHLQNVETLLAEMTLLEDEPSRRRGTR